MLKRKCSLWSRCVRDPKNGWSPRPSPVAPARVCVSAPIDRAAVRSVRTIERVTCSGRAGDWEAALIMRPAVASMGDRSDFLCMARADAVGKCALREKVAGDYCNRGQDRNSNLAHMPLISPKTWIKTIATCRKRNTRKDAVQNDQPSRLTLKACPCRMDKGPRAPAHVQPAVAAIRNSTKAAT